MTKKQFKEALLRGQGRCMQAVQKDASRYYDIVLWACSHTIAFDAQSEGTRSLFVYELICQYEDKMPFIEESISCFKKVKSDGGWKVLYLAELLGFFACDGIAIAEQALWEKYDSLYEILLKKKQLRTPFFHERDDFEAICLVLANNQRTFLSIAKDIGQLYRRTTIYDGGDFSWFHSAKDERYLSALEKLRKQSADIERYVEVKAAYDKAYEIRQKDRQATIPKSGPALSLWLKRKADAHTIETYESRTKALEAFWRCPYPSDPLPIITDAMSEDEGVRAAAWRALENIRHPLVRQFALAQLEDNVEDALSVLIKNYEKEDSKLLEKLMLSIPVDFSDTSHWHGIHLDVLRFGDEGGRVSVSVLLHMLETSYCSLCRKSILEQLGTRRQLTKEILEECLWDSYEDTRVYAKNRLKRRTLK